MVKQFDIAWINLNPIKGKEKAGNYRPVVIVSNEYINGSTGLTWIMPITSRKAKYPSDIPIKTTHGKITGCIDTVQIRCIDFKARQAKVVDHLDPSLHQMIIDSIEVHTEIID
ncbi:type II toxin-antitoxin system PemK/MazF family toxin [Hutsoniella sourekii]|uniref:type II toxin-antitoxin system PemK/MazF family toxin n=1 Tax=Hutsoniella sourekii TaxID=87650 RepID=UPI000489237A|nr:type II toxin-antitoxin system PemK/MazF family toxin [Hutsoniella sourekii]